MKVLIVLLAAISLAACSTPPPHKFVADPDKRWEQRKTELSEINDWLLSGRVAIVNTHESWHLNMKWQKHDDKYILDLSGPFGAGHAQLTGTKEGVLLVDADQRSFYADNPDQLLQEVTGVRMPVQSLLYWIRGLSNNNIKKDKQMLDNYGRLALLEQAGWSVRFKSYVDIEQHEMPQKIFIDGSDLKVKIFIEEWNLKSKTFQFDNEG
ncbi:MAG: lipoprotein insertase outer membrane protein LolB [Gammaproteobacteria bacterium]|nr:lipoprotein insertase outer membrane protein LolB [Gammaproteobacteria bacterium]MCW8986256.1 lipoprotein insertase outer membrane protein LolB [Gammaproteobacteria bacterium]MCW9031325.1 lipoprotein insertase outer membrane protein LolB [Gammaproteobacteria bacterium]